MTISRKSLDTIPTSFASVSLGTPDDPLPEKLSAISSAGFQAIELGFPDLLSFASKHHGRKIKENDYENLCQAGEEVKKLCAANNLQIMMLQPFSNFEGWPAGSPERKDAFERAHGWIKIMQAVGTDMLQVGASDSPNITSDLHQLAADLGELADLLALHSFRLAYENWCWATHVAMWPELLEVVKIANRPNLGLCLDTFQMAGAHWADPTTKSGLIETVPREDLEAQFKMRLEEFAKEAPPEKIYLLQISDAYKPAEPLEDKLGEDGLRPRGRWSHDFRPYPFNGGYLPVTEVTKAVLQTGTRCWFSMEVFDGGKDGKGGMKYDLREFAKGAMASHKKLLDACADSE